MESRGITTKISAAVDTLYSMADPRQVVKYTFVKVDPPVLSWPAEDRQAATRELAALLEERSEAGTLLTYSTVGLRGDCDILIWEAADTVDAIQQAESRWRGTQLGPFLTVAHSFLAMMRPSPYLGKHRHADQEGTRTRLKPAGGRYLFVYPMWKKRVWYRLPYERRKAMMIEHFAIGHRYPQVKINTAYSFGLDDQEFVVAFECDEPAAFLDLVMELRESQASRYTERETPIFTCVRMAPADALQLALGLHAEDARAAEARRQVSLLAGG
jgi:chlorite dismutase